MLARGASAPPATHKGHPSMQHGVPHEPIPAEREPADVRNLAQVALYEVEGWRLIERSGACPWTGKQIVALCHEPKRGPVRHVEISRRTYAKHFSAAKANLINALRFHNAPKDLP